MKGNEGEEKERGGMRQAERKRSSAGCTVFSFRFTSLVERSAGCIPQESQRCRNKGRKREKEGERGRGAQRGRERTTLRHFNWILLNFDSDPHSCNCNKLYLLLLLIGLAR